MSISEDMPARTELRVPIIDGPDSLIRTGIPSKEQIKSVMPSPERRKKGPVVMIECFQRIPCNPCTEACPQKAITMTGDINDTPEVNEELCTGCGACLMQCPGLAIFIVDETFDSDMALIRFPFEYYPLPKAGQYVQGTDRSGKILGWFKVNRVIPGKGENLTSTVCLEVPQNLLMEVRSMKEGEYRDEIGR